MSRILRPTRAADIKHELDAHPGREYSIDMIHMALHYREPERQATQQALLLMERQGFVARAARGRYVSVKTPSPVRSMTDAELDAEATKNAANVDDSFHERMVTATARSAGFDGPNVQTVKPSTNDVADLLSERGYVEYPQEGVSGQPEPEPSPLAGVLEKIGQLETVQIIGRSAKSDAWIGVGLSDGTVYRVEEM